MSTYGLLIDYRYCTGCHTCEIACNMEHGTPVDKFGIKLAEVGPWQIDDDRWQLSYVPIPTELCDLCKDRTAKGKHPTCVHHCQSDAIRYGKLEDLLPEIEGKSQMALFVP